MSAINQHPFAVDALLEQSVVLSFALPKQDIEDLIPAPLTADTFQDRYAFVAVALVQTRNLRPAFLPNLFGTDFFLIGYRVFVRYKNNAGRNLRGLYIIRSETDSTRMKILGSIFTKYQYTKTAIVATEHEGSLSYSAAETGFELLASQQGNQTSLPTGSPFKDWKEARRFAGPLPFTFTANAKSREVLIVEGQRDNWIPEPLAVLSYNIPFLEQEMFRNRILANAFIIRNIPYHWKKGKIEKW
jgi:hypothetical protein